MQRTENSALLLEKIRAGLSQKPLPADPNPLAFMKKSISYFFIIIVGLILNGCWIALPSDGPPGSKEYIGKIYKLQRDILLVSYWITPITWETNEKQNIGSNQKVLATLKAGDEIKIISIKSFRLPSGVNYSFRCIDLINKNKFDLQFQMLDCIGLPSNLIIKEKMLTIGSADSSTAALPYSLARD